MARPVLRIDAVDPQSPQALALLHEAAVEARRLYADLTDADAPWPTNRPASPRSVYLLAWRETQAVGCGALQPLDGEGLDVAEVRRIFVTVQARRSGVASAVLAALEVQARRLGYQRLMLETGERQPAAIALYTAHGYRRIAPFGAYVGDPTSVCFERSL